jgi:hypothetical protein
VAIVAAAAVVAVALVVAAFVVRSGADEEAAGSSSSITTTTRRAPTTTAPGSPSTTAPTGSPSTTAPTGPSTTTTAPGPPIDPATLQAEVTALSAYVEQQRGLSFRTPVRPLVLPDTEFEQRLGDQIPPEEIEQQAAMLQMLGLVPPDQDASELIREALLEGVQGWYDATTKELVVRGGTLSDDVRQTLVHELTHALDDQAFDLDRPEYDERPDEIGFGFRAVVEGDATRIERTWHDQFNAGGNPPNDVAPAIPPGSPPELQAVATQLGSPYLLGSRLVRDLLDRGAQPALDQSFGDPPTTSEQVLHPDKYAVREPRREVPPPPTDGGKTTDEGVFGEVMTRGLLSSKIPVADAERAAAGWGGDWYVAWTDRQGASCLRVDWQMDTAAELAELRTALDAYSAAEGAGQIESPTPDTVRWTNCVQVSGGGVSPL